MEFTPDLLDDFINMKVAIFIGAGVSSGVQTRRKEHIRTWAEFIKATAEQAGNSRLLEEVNVLVNSGDLLFACEVLKEHYGDRWDDILRTEYEVIGGLSELQKGILKLNQRVIVTTNFDLFIENNWDQVYSNATHYLQVKNGINHECFALFRDNKNYLIKIHGSINQPETMVFSLSDYAGKAYSNWQYATFIEMLLNSFTILFIGFSMKDHAITNILDSYAKKYPKSRPHYAFLADYDNEINIGIMKKHRKLFVLPYSSKDNHAELSEIITDLPRQIEDRKKITSMDKNI